MRNKKITIFYNPLMVMDCTIDESYSKSPLKPRLLIEKLEELGFLQDYFSVNSGFPPFSPEDFLVAHDPNYVEHFFAGKYPLREGNWIPWSEQLVTSVTYTNSSLYHSILHAADNPGTVCLSPTSGFHHATPKGGRAYCTFSGQVIASVKIYRERGLKGAYLDLDAHFGNSIEDSREFVPDLNEAIPLYGNFNPVGYGEGYLKELQKYLAFLEEKICAGEIDYVVWCHGADSHEWDDLGGQVNTEQWIKCSQLFYSWLSALESRLNRHIPVALSLFGGYREDDYNPVISLHIADLAECHRSLLQNTILYDPVVKPKQKA